MRIYTAFVGGARTRFRLLARAEKTEREGLPQVARLFRTVAKAHRVHATNHLLKAQSTECYVPQVRGYISDRSSLERCSVCGISSEKFKKRETRYYRSNSNKCLDFFIKSFINTNSPGLPHYFPGNTMRAE